jgi:hypothetical protein
LAISEISDIEAGCFVDELSVVAEHYEESCNIPSRNCEFSNNGLLNDPTKPFIDEPEIEDVRGSEKFGGDHFK